MIARIIRWLLLPVSAVAMIAGAVFGARWAVALVDRRCPADSLVGGACVAPWHTSAVEASMYVAIALAALGVVVLSGLIAPRLKRTVPTIAFAAVVGTMAAPWALTNWDGLLLPLAIATASGGIGLWWVWPGRAPGKLNDARPTNAAS
jgi:hypothetical protein